MDVVPFALGIAVFFGLQAFQENLLFFYSPTQVLAGEQPDARKFRLGGIVASGSLQRSRARSLQQHASVVQPAEQSVNIRDHCGSCPEIESDPIH